MLSIKNSAHLIVHFCNYFSFIVSLFAYYVVLFHVRNKDNNNYCSYYYCYSYSYVFTLSWFYTLIYISQNVEN